MFFGEQRLPDDGLIVRSAEAIHKSTEGTGLESNSARVQSAQTKEQKPEYWHSPTPTHG